jgi:hypothetical protein
MCFKQGQEGMLDAQLRPKSMEQSGCYQPDLLLLEASGAKDATSVERSGDMFPRKRRR